MTGQGNLNKFNKIYDDTYKDVLKYIIIKCQNINDSNDILQEVYYEFWKILNKKIVEEKNIKSFLLSIANNKIKKYYSLFYKLKTISLFSKNNELELIEIIDNNLNIENLIINKNNWNDIWIFLKSKKDQNIPKVFYLYYCSDLKIKEIANELNVSESYIKDLIYRTLKELKNIFEKENK